MLSGERAAATTQQPPAASSLTLWQASYSRRPQGGHRNQLPVESTRAIHYVIGLTCYKHNIVLCDIHWRVDLSNSA